MLVLQLRKVLGPYIKECFKLLIKNRLCNVFFYSTYLLDKLALGRGPSGSPVLYGQISREPDIWPSYSQGGGPRVVVSTAAFHARVRGSVPGLGGLKETKLFLPHRRVKVSIMGSLCDREVACSASDRQGSNFKSCVWRTVLSQSSHHPQEVLLAQFSLYVHKGGLKPDSFHFISYSQKLRNSYYDFYLA